MSVLVRRSPSDDLRSRSGATARQVHLLLAVNSADKLLVPTQRQAQTFPAHVRGRITVIHDGIDTDRVNPREGAVVQIPGTRLRFRKGDEVVTFINRNLEPPAAFTFMLSLPKLLKARPQAHVVLVGGDGKGYSPSPPARKTWKQTLLDEVGDRFDLSRVHFVGAVPLLHVRRFDAGFACACVSDIPFRSIVADAGGYERWGACGRIANPSVEEVIEDSVNGRLIDFFDVEAWSSVLTEALADPAKLKSMRAAA
jgi:glycosyltransferase involved in cell wall biosynthesis